MKTTLHKADSPPAPIVIVAREHNLDELLAAEWLLTNNIGAYASSSAAGCNTRRYHGLLIAATAPPVGRVNALTQVMEWVTVGDTTHALATNEFPSSISPRGIDHLVKFVNDTAPTFVYRIGELELTKRIILAERANAVAIQYTLTGGSAKMHLRPFAALRDFHHLRQESDGQQLSFQASDGGVIVQDLGPAEGFANSLHLSSQDAEFTGEPQWWRQFRYRVDSARGQDCLEDLYSPGVFEFDLTDGKPVQFNASLGEEVALGFDTTLRQRRTVQQELAASVIEWGDETAQRLAVAADAFVVRRNFTSTGPSAPAETILAGFPWFADWGRDAFIALPGLLLTTKRFETARRVFSTFAEHISEGMIPNRFDDYSNAPHYNSIDASLWFILAADRYVAASEDSAFWRDVLMPAAIAIVEAYSAGTRFDIRADADGLLTGGSIDTQLTWMDAKLGDEVITARHGKAVEINALWYNAHAVLAERCRPYDAAAADRYGEQAHLIAGAFSQTFWNEQTDCLYDCVTNGTPDASIRPNQIFAVSLPHSPLATIQQHGVLRAVTERLLTPFGLRTLSPSDPRYRGQYGGSWESRDRAYHQGTVWAWLLGPYVEAFLKLRGHQPTGVMRARDMLSAFDDDVLRVGLGQISEIFDGDPPHRARGCFAQAWSVGEVLRAKQLVEQFAASLDM